MAEPKQKTGDMIMYENPQIIEFNLRGVDFRNRNLTNVIFRGCDLRGADFRGANLESAQILYSDIREANFSTANMDNVDLTGSVFSESIAASQEEQEERDRKAEGILMQAREKYYANLQNGK